MNQEQTQLSMHLVLIILGKEHVEDKDIQFASRCQKQLEIPGVKRNVQSKLVCGY